MTHLWRWHINFCPGWKGYFKSLSPDELVKVRQKYQGRGIMTRAVKALCRYTFEELGMNRVQIKCAIGNAPSSNIPKRLGFQFEGVERAGEMFADGNFVDIEIYSFLKNEYHSTN